MEDTNKKCILVRKEEINKTLSNEPKEGKRQLEPLASLAGIGLPFQVIEIVRSTGEAEIHMGTGDLFQCLEGEVTFIYGGQLLNSWEKAEGELRAKEIQNGTKVVLKPGDWFWIPAGQPHQNSCSGITRLLVVKIPQISL